MGRDYSNFADDTANQAASDSNGVSKFVRGSGGAGKGDRSSAGWIITDKYQRSMQANEAYAAGEITLEEWRAIVHPKSSQDQGEN